ncbi:thiolase family protein [Pseudonocardia sp. 73-21]|uniref:thiolase family protein n=1 Tax=Pseudonocardia sp. 73-21 TaxID=1895809 RepID=UPI00095D9622|nr:thiolase family protein [Pseudonocardia sp. 73-21]OJY48104.1 MAG: thiolase [Pseudonocardia sp. 73-21]
MSEAVHVVGVSCTRFGRHPDRGAGTMARQALSDVLADAGTHLRDVGAVFYANVSQKAVEGQHMIPGQVALRPAGVTGIPVVNVENACAGGATAFWLAVAHVRSGQSPAAVAVGVDKLVLPDAAAALAVFDGALDRAHRCTALRTLNRVAGVAHEPGEHEGAQDRRSVFMDIYAALALAHMNRFGTTARQLATVAAKNHLHSVDNERAQYRRPFTVDDVLAARTVAHPLTVPMCSPVSDGAAAVLVGNTDFAASLPTPDRHVTVRASVLVSGSDREPDDVEAHLGRRAAIAAYEQAGLGPRDVDVAEVHDATAFGEIQQTENLGFCPIGDGGQWAESGASALGGRLPVNPSGGLVSRGHPVSATGLAQLFELVTQLRGEAGARQVDGARIAVAENGGALYGVEEAVAAISVLEKGFRR